MSNSEYDNSQSDYQSYHRLIDERQKISIGITLEALNYLLEMFFNYVTL